MIRIVLRGPSHSAGAIASDWLAQPGLGAENAFLPTQLVVAAHHARRQLFQMSAQVPVCRRDNAFINNKLSITLGNETPNTQQRARHDSTFDPTNTTTFQ